MIPTDPKRLGEYPTRRSFARGVCYLGLLLSLSLAALGAMRHQTIQKLLIEPFDAYTHPLNPGIERIIMESRVIQYGAEAARSMRESDEALAQTQGTLGESFRAHAEHALEDAAILLHLGRPSSDKPPA